MNHAPAEYSSNSHRSCEHIAPDLASTHRLEIIILPGLIALDQSAHRLDITIPDPIALDLDRTQL